MVSHSTQWFTSWGGRMRLVEVLFVDFWRKKKKLTTKSEITRQYMFLIKRRMAWVCLGYEYPYNTTWGDLACGEIGFFEKSVPLTKDHQPVQPIAPNVTISPRPSKSLLHMHFGHFLQNSTIPSKLHQKGGLPSSPPCHI